MFSVQTFLPFFQWYHETVKKRPPSIDYSIDGILVSILHIWNKKNTPRVAPNVTFSSDLFPSLPCSFGINLCSSTNDQFYSFMKRYCQFFFLVKRRKTMCNTWHTTGSNVRLRLEIKIKLCVQYRQIIRGTT